MKGSSCCCRAWSARWRITSRTRHLAKKEEGCAKQKAVKRQQILRITELGRQLEYKKEKAAADLFLTGVPKPLHPCLPWWQMNCNDCCEWLEAHKGFLHALCHLLLGEILSSREPDWSDWDTMKTQSDKAQWWGQGNDNLICDAGTVTPPIVVWT